MAEFYYEPTYIDTKTHARVGTIHTPHGNITTPAFVPVGTQGTVKSVSPDELRALDTHLFFVNTYHMYLRPGLETVNRYGGLHRFIAWDRPLITDSGGFQVFSLARNHSKDEEMENRPVPLAKIGEDGVEFQSHWDGSKHLFTPEVSMEAQWILGADIHIAFDDCTPYPVTHDEAQKSMDRTHRWAVRSLAAHQSLAAIHAKQKKPYQALYGSIQGSVYEDLRRESTKTITAMSFDGIAIGGVSVGESKQEMSQVLDWVLPALPVENPRHLLGVGEIDDIFPLIESGVDTFDCVQPTRLARVGTILICPDCWSDHRYRLDITKSMFAQDMSPLDPHCSCTTCEQFTRGYIHHLFHVHELLAYRLTSVHNIHVMHTLVAAIRTALQNGSYSELKKYWLG